MDDIQFNKSSTKNTLTAKIIGSFIQNRQQSLREISKKSGITVANLSKCFTGMTMLTLPYFVRIAAAVGNDELYDWVFDIPVKRYLVRKVTSPNVLSDTDYVFFLLLLKDYFRFQNEHRAEDILNAIFKKLSQQLINTCPENEYCHGEDLFNSFYNIFYDNRNLIRYAYPEISIDDHHFGMLMQSGGTVIWQDVRNLITWYLSENNMRINAMKNKSILVRIRSTSEQAYKIDELLDADNEMQMNGIFFSACCLASKNNIILSKICTNDSVIDLDLLAKVQYGIASFFSCLRILEQNPEKRQALQNFWTFFRQTAADSPYRMTQLRVLSEEFIDFLPINPLRFFM
ncbi:MAG: hypothetical protein IJI42_01695 [Methanobrevibacter sp.]|nr:hypothetical protein [Methanobrevibacter sp.]